MNFGGLCRRKLLQFPGAALIIIKKIPGGESHDAAKYPSVRRRSLFLLFYLCFFSVTGIFTGYFFVRLFVSK